MKPLAIIALLLMVGCALKPSAKKGMNNARQACEKLRKEVK